MTTMVKEVKQEQQQRQQQLPKSLQNGFVVFDLEWDPYTPDNEILLLAASFVDNNEKRTVLLVLLT
jgi:hypothetical protein